MKITELEHWLAENKTRTTVPMEYVEPLIQKLRYYHKRNSDYLDVIVDVGKKLCELRDELNEQIRLNKERNQPNDKEKRGTKRQDNPRSTTPEMYVDRG